MKLYLKNSKERVIAKLSLIGKFLRKEYFQQLILLSQAREERNFFFEKNDLQKMNVLRRIIAPMGSMDAIEFINSKLKNTKSNTEFFNSMNKPS